MTSGTENKCLAQPSSVAAQYETLRMAALGEPLPPEARNGLMLFLRRGMWGWARMLDAASVRQEPIHTLSSKSSESCERKAVMYVFAAMAMNANSRRAP